MLRIGLTGSIATGKSTVLSGFEALGVPTYSADAAVHELYEGDAVAAMETMFPGAVKNGKVDRAALSLMLSAEPGRVAELEALIHPLVRDKAMAFFEEAELSGAPMAVIEIPLLFETGSRYGLDAIVTTHCREDILRERALARPHMTQAKLALILDRQIGQDEKRELADHAIDTSGTIEETIAQTKTLFDHLRARAASGHVS